MHIPTRYYSICVIDQSIFLQVSSFYDLGRFGSHIKMIRIGSSYLCKYFAVKK